MAESPPSPPHRTISSTFSTRRITTFTNSTTTEPAGPWTTWVGAKPITMPTSLDLPSATCSTFFTLTPTTELGGCAKTRAAPIHLGGKPMTTTTTRSLVVLTLAAVLAVLCPAGSAQDITVPVIVANNDNPATNSASGYTLGGVSEGTLNTGGIGLGSGYFAATSEAVSSNGHCVFVVDDGSDDV